MLDTTFIMHLILGGMIWLVYARIPYGVYGKWVGMEHWRASGCWALGEFRGMIISMGSFLGGTVHYHEHSRDLATCKSIE